ncbi:glycosyltransferase [Shewanella sp. SP2S2-4]|uniref:glycosyltransferase n=1 Tax=Shewanella sp. SP2S2-4 TaxID=3063539 RepID=UPI00288E4218|nr:glycosyltransferase [Shewanella sp. SP2S2-4]MDT3275666.1 glycosyltransferase [Shewanella sp. SP2S2-4]
MRLKVNFHDLKNVAVIMSVYKSDDPFALELAVGSILEQDYPCDLYIYLDGVLTEDLYLILNKFSSDYSVTIISSSINNGLAFSLNVLIDTVVSKGYDFIARMDSDDISRHDRLSKQVDFLVANPDISVCGTFCSEFGSSYSLSEKKLPVEHDDLLKFSIARCPFIHPTVMFKNSLFELGYRYPLNTHLTEDMAFWFLLLHRGFKFANVGQVLLDYRLNENTIERRRGLSKSVNETKLRFYYMFVLKQMTILNFFYISSRFFFHLLPPSFVKFLYRRFR